MKKQSLYPKTKRISDTDCVITEKLDGSNIGFLRLEDELIIATRNNVYKLSEIDEYKQMMYKGMYGWLKEHGEHLKNNLHEGSGIFGEWIGMGKLKYPELGKKMYIFAKANISYENNTYEVRNINYDRELFIYPFVEQTIPKYLNIVPCIRICENIPTISELNKLYEEYTNVECRNVEGFIIIKNNDVKKYVRMKNGTLENHKEDKKPIGTSYRLK